MKLRVIDADLFSANFAAQRMLSTPLTLHVSELMKYRAENWIDTVRKWGAFVCVTFTASLFWGFVIAGILRYLIDLPQEYAFVVICPVAVSVAIFAVANREKLFIAMGFDNGGFR